jgi:hypothetical protein
MADNSFVSRKPQLIKEFRNTIKAIRPVLDSRYEGKRTANMIEDAYREFESLIPQLPEVGPQRTLRQFAVSTGWFLAMYRALVRQGASLDDVGSLIYEASDAYLKAVPGFMRNFFSLMSFSPRYLKGLEKQARESQERRFPQGYVFTFIPGDGKAFDYGVDYTECASCKFLAAQGVPELTRFVCAVDYIYSEKLGWGLHRTTTLAVGDKKCDFRFKKGGKTDIVLPFPPPAGVRG